MLKLEKYIIRAKDLQRFEFSVILIAEGNSFSVVEKYKFSVFFKIMCVRGKKTEETNQ